MVVQHSAETTTARQPSTASPRFWSSSSKVSPWVAQPRMDGTAIQEPPSFASWIMAFSFFNIEHGVSAILLHGGIQKSRHGRCWGASQVKFQIKLFPFYISTNRFHSASARAIVPSSQSRNLFSVLALSSA